MEEVPRQDEDAVLLDAWRVRDDAAALERLVEKYRAPLFSLIFRYVGDVHEAGDCFQETWARVLPRLDAARSGKLLAFLLSLLLAGGALAQTAGTAAPARGPEDQEVSRECFELAQRIRRCGDAAEQAALTAELRAMVAERHAARIEDGKRRIADAERAIAERHAAALRGLEAVKQRVAEAESHLPEGVEREMDALLGRAVASDE